MGSVKQALQYVWLDVRIHQLGKLIALVRVRVLS
jgi:hypothetical protein